MDNSTKTYIGDIGTDLILDTKTDLSLATSVKILYKKPGQNLIAEWTGAVFETTKIKYTFVADDLDTVGVYKIMAHVVIPTWSGCGETAHFQVYALML